jgi:hypothetical protein
MKERRIYERFQLSLPARLEMNYSEKKEIFELQTKDISAAGVLLSTKERFAVGARCQLELTVTSKKIRELTGAQSLIKVQGTVVRSTADGVAICFDGECEILGLKGS